jgi:hypothetical protein
MKDMLAELKVNHDELRRDRDEWRWRAERLLADQQRGAWWRWRRQAAVALRPATVSFCRLLADAKNKLAEMKASWKQPRRGGEQWRSQESAQIAKRRAAGRVS